MLKSVLTFLILSILLYDTSCQRRRNFHHNGNNRGRRNFQNNRQRPPSSFFQQQQMYQRFPHEQQIINEHESIIDSQNFCRHIQLMKQTNEQIYGNLILDSVKDLKGMNIEIEFDRPIIGFVNNFGHSSSIDNRIFTIKNDMKNLKRGEQLNIEYFVNIDQRFPPPTILKLILNGKQLCPHVENFNSECANLEMLTNGTIGGRYDAILTIFPNQLFNGGRKIDFEFDVKSWALGNDVGESVTKDQKHYTIFNNKANSGQSLIINFFVKFDEFEEIPKLKNLYVDDVAVCLPHNENAENIKRSNFYSSPSFFNQSESNMLLTDLPFNSFPSVTISPKQVFNNNYECGLTGNVVTTRVNDGITAHFGQFPFHAALFYDYRYRCGSTLIAEKISLTASHCVVSPLQKSLPVENFYLLFGVIDLQTLSGNEALRRLSRIITHPNYQHDKILKQDIALLIIEGNLQFSQFIRPICLPDVLPSISQSIDKELTVIGFGSSTESLKLSRYLHYGTMKVISREECTEKLILALLPEQSTFCAKSKENMLACGGMFEIINGKFYLRGISSVTVTESNGKCITENPVGFTDVKAFLMWIRENMRQIA
ncbi:hypothetical protein PVAND_009364 [Polypedilum vanderplanki]|uniref:Peptidase S1 domain-containing protein n=1 Tax=Polypedilum vanderplanki TaxID=319348 RepID=A0A9J6CCN9_POLVA|nr:hypothetical protein PVAND_009364 [Polypedilum vanderplanki]